MRIRWSRTALMAVAGLLAVAAIAVAKSATVGVGRASVHGHKESVAVNAKGVTIYELGPETSRHLVCKSQSCFAAWPPVKAKGALTKMAGVTGKLGTIKRDGFTQVTLDGKPVYTFVEDGGRRGEAEGDGIRNFGGVWHVFKES
jgi:predicted lipoprotein with Yx(FWY)xxD motif